MTHTPNPIDVHVGLKVRARRMACGISQEKLGEEVGLTFQQIQKYEKGTNRMGSSRLWQFAQILGCPVEHFFEGLAGKSPDAGTIDPVTEVMPSKDGLALNEAFLEIHDPKVRKQIVELAKVLSTDQREDLKRAA